MSSVEIFCSAEKPTDMVIFISAAMVVLVFILILIAAVVSVAYKKKKGEKSKWEKYLFLFFEFVNPYCHMSLVTNGQNLK